MRLFAVFSAGLHTGPGAAHGGYGMSFVKVTDQSGGVYQATIEFTYGECERLPFNMLRRIGAKIDVVPEGGIRANANFNIRVPADSAAFLEILDLFGEDGSYVHGSAADPAALTQTAPAAAGLDVSFGGDDDDDDDLELEGSIETAE